MLTDEELRALEELEQKATSGPWQFEDREGDFPSSFIWSTTSNSGTDEADNCHNRIGETRPYHGRVVLELPSSAYDYASNWDDNGQFIAALRNAAKSLIASARREKEYRAALEKIATYKKRNDSESDGQTIISLQVIAEEAINPTKLVFSEALKKGDQ